MLTSPVFARCATEARVRLSPAHRYRKKGQRCLTRRDRNSPPTPGRPSATDALGGLCDSWATRRQTRVVNYEFKQNVSSASQDVPGSQKRRRQGGEVGRPAFTESAQLIPRP